MIAASGLLTRLIIVVIPANAGKTHLLLFSPDDRSVMGLPLSRE